jgi:hypothetical protein
MEKKVWNIFFTMAILFWCQKIVCIARKQTADFISKRWQFRLKLIKLFSAANEILA